MIWAIGNALLKDLIQPTVVWPPDKADAVGPADWCGTGKAPDGWCKR
ncbi:hypothetical protein [Herbidospora mongoliensis]|nr:hypothetical protein [Herbidospora mongoliensis]